MSQKRKRHRPPVQGGRPDFTILTRDDLDKVGARCYLCERLIDYREAPAAGELESTTSGRTAYVYETCARRARVLGNELLK